jgi:hypothetical protein
MNSCHHKAAPVRLQAVRRVGDVGVFAKSHGKLLALTMALALAQLDDCLGEKNGLITTSTATDKVLMLDY